MLVGLFVASLAVPLLIFPAAEHSDGLGRAIEMIFISIVAAFGVLGMLIGLFPLGKPRAPAATPPLTGQQKSEHSGNQNPYDY
jgi:hypothetical protein